jgi:outer membrane protein
MINLRICAGVAALAFSIVSAEAALPANSSSPGILVVDRHAIMNGSKLGMNIRQQIMDYEQKLQADLGPEGEALQNETQAFQQQSASLPPDVRAKKNQALQAKQADYRQKIQERQGLIQGGELAARQRYLAEVGAVVHEIMAERGANVVLEKSTVVDIVNGLDITSEVIRRLDGKISSFKVPLVKPPANGQIQMR